MLDKLKQALKELLTSKEKTVSDISSDAPPAGAPVLDATVEQPETVQPQAENVPAAAVEQTNVEPSAAAVVQPAAVVEKKEEVADRVVQDFKKAFDYVTHGITVLGEDARDELIKLASKYL